MAFSVEEQAILAQLAYRDIKTSETDPISLYDCLTKFGNETYLREKLDESYHAVLDGLLEKVKDQDYKIVCSVDQDHTTGFVAFAIADPNNEVTIVSRGSEDLSKVLSNKDSARDLVTDLEIGVFLETDQQQCMEALVEKLEKKGYDGYYFTGHSLGGNLSIHGAVTLKNKNKLKGVTTFNAPGFNDGYWAFHGPELTYIQNRVVNYENEYDYVSSIFKKPGTTYYVDSLSDTDDYGFSHHSITNLRLGKGGFCLVGKKGERMFPVDALTDGYVNNERWSKATFLLYVYARITGSKLLDFRDFSDTVLQDLIDAVKETEEEDWWQVDRWDCWYRLDKAFGSPVMEYQRMTGDVDTYYRKLVDMNGASVSDIQKIFRKARELDDTYAGKLRTGNDRLVSSVVKKLWEVADNIAPMAGMCPATNYK